MLRIYASVNKKEVSFSWSLGQTLPQVDGKILRLEASGGELLAISKEKEIPLSSIDNSCVIWHGRNAGRILNLLRKIVEEK